MKLNKITVLTAVTMILLSGSTLWAHGNEHHGTSHHETSMNTHEMFETKTVEEMFDIIDANITALAVELNKEQINAAKRELVSLKKAVDSLKEKVEHSHMDHDAEEEAHEDHDGHTGHH